MFFTAAIVATVLVYIWFFEGRTDRAWVYVAGAIVLVLAFVHALRRRAWGFDWTAVRGSARLAAPWTAAAVIGIGVAGAMAGTIHDRRDFLGTFLALVAWGGAQQWVLQTAVLRDT
ncbi:MAG: hypothetical protein WD227_04000, partial [Vicinamibacterales bacterium]